MRLVTVEEMRGLERATFAAGMTEAALMKRAGSAVARAAADWLVNPHGLVLLVLAGKGNNGGDALIAARALASEHGMVPRVYLAADRGDDPLLAWAHERNVPWAMHDEDGGWQPALSGAVGADGGSETADGEGTTQHAARTTHHAPHSTAAISGVPEERRAPQSRLLEQWLREADVVLDGLLGIGARLPLRGAVAEILAACAAVRPPGQRRIAVDLPTGVDADTGQADERAFRADLTLSTGPAKPGLFFHPGAEYAGRVRALDIGLSQGQGSTFNVQEGGGALPGLESDGEAEGATLWRAEAADVARLLPVRPDDSHKGTFGKVLVVGDSSHYTGAAYLAGAAAVRAGAGLVTLAVPAAAQAALAGRSVETTYLPLPDDPAAPGALTPGHLGALLGAAREYDAVAVGPGIGGDPATRRLVLLLLEHLAQEPDGPPIVVDADGLNALASAPEADRPRPPAPGRWVLTPHPGEMGRLTGLHLKDVQADRLVVARERAAKWQTVVLLKGAPSVIAAPDGRAWLSGFPNAALATAGAGDVLTGTIAALLAQGCAPADAAVAGSYVHGLAAEVWRHRHGAAGLAVAHLAECLPDALRHVRGMAPLY